MKYIKISYNKKMKKIIVTTLSVSVLTCGCGLKGVSQSKTALQNSDQEEVVNENPIEQTNQGVNKEKDLASQKTVTSEEEYSDILKAQEKWKEYQEAEFVAISIIINKQGTIYQTITLGEKEFIVKQRALALKNLYEYWIE